MLDLIKRTLVTSNLVLVKGYGREAGLSSPRQPRLNGSRVG